jgi:hypothetical protein
MTNCVFQGGQKMDVFYYNKWTELQVPEVGQCFKRVSIDDVVEIAKEGTVEDAVWKIEQGELVWFDQEPYHHHGKVYGYSGLRVRRMELTIDPEREEKSVRMYIGGGFTTLSSKYSGRVYTLENPKRLRELLVEHGAILTSAGYGRDPDTFSRFMRQWEAAGLYR